MRNRSGGGGMPGMEGLMKKADSIKQNVSKTQDSLKERVVEGTAGGDAVVCQINGAREIVSLKIKPEAIDAEDPSLTEDVVMAAVNQALKKADDMINKEMKKATGGLNLPGLF